NCTIPVKGAVFIMNEVLLVPLIDALPLFTLGIFFFIIVLVLYRQSKYCLYTNGSIVKQDETFLYDLDLLLTNNQSLMSKRPDQQPTFTYQVNHEKYTKTSKVKQKPGFHPGTTVTVLYNPEDPSKAVINSIAQRGVV